MDETFKKIIDEYFGEELYDYAWEEIYERVNKYYIRRPLCCHYEAKAIYTCGIRWNVMERNGTGWNVVERCLSILC